MRMRQKLASVTGIFLGSGTSNLFSEDLFPTSVLCFSLGSLLLPWTSSHQCLALFLVYLLPLTLKILDIVICPFCACLSLPVHLNQTSGLYFSTLELHLGYEYFRFYPIFLISNRIKVDSLPCKPQITLGQLI